MGIAVSKACNSQAWGVMKLNNVLKKPLLDKPFKNSKCKEQKKFKVDAYLDRFEFEVFEATKQLGDFQRSVKQSLRAFKVYEKFIPENLAAGFFIIS